MSTRRPTIAYDYLGPLNELWVPGREPSFRPERVKPSQTELLQTWARYYGGYVMNIPGVFSAAGLPSGQRRALFSLDVDEVVRATGQVIDEITTPNSLVIGDDNISSYRRHLGASAINVMVFLANKGLLPPVTKFEAIANDLRTMRAAGVYIVANTATEHEGTYGLVNHFFARHFRGCFDALLMPNNHLQDRDGVTKASSVVNLIDTLQLPIDTIVHIDDSTKHLADFEATFRGRIRRLLLGRVWPYGAPIGIHPKDDIAGGAPEVVAEVGRQLVGGGRTSTLAS